MDEFIVNALLAGVGLALVAGPLGCIVVWRRMAYFGDTLAHSALLGVLVIGICLAAVLFWLERHRELSSDTLLGILAHSALATGLIVFSLIQARSPGIDLMAYLFGDILAVQRGELVWIYTGALLILLVFSRLWRALIAISVHEELARADGVPVARTRFLFMLLLAMTIAVAIKVVGILLVTALLIIPAASARAFSVTPLQMALFAALFAVLAVVMGLGASLYWDLPSGPAIVVAAAASFFVTRAGSARV